MKGTAWRVELNKKVEQRNSKSCIVYVNWTSTDLRPTVIHVVRKSDGGKREEANLLHFTVNGKYGVLCLVLG